ncbi:MAG: hypothetical protein IKL73_00065 [Lachnospiraceae bacterium]|nr:hypothetical protein [Lachnospiraceae bacterium]
MKRIIYAIIGAAIIFAIFFAITEVRRNSYEKKSTKVAERFLNQYVAMDTLALSTYVAKEVDSTWDDDFYNTVTEYNKHSATFSYKIEEVLIYQKPFDASFCAKAGVKADDLEYVSEIKVIVTATAYGEIYTKTAYVYVGRIDKEWKIVYQSGL